MVNIQEIIFDIALNAGYLIATGQIEVGDSRELYQTVRSLAKKVDFELMNVSPDFDYLTFIDEFTERELKGLYGDPKSADTYAKSGFGVSRIGKEGGAF